jgi:protein MpaA
MLGDGRTFGIKLFSSFFFVVFMLLVSSPGAMGSDVKNKSKKEFCDNVNGKFRKFGWGKIVCNPDRWETYDYSSQGNPLVYQEFGFENNNSEGPVNLVLCGVHGDEPSAMYQCFHLVRDIVYDNPLPAENFKLVVAPLVNPDGFFLNTRQNANGVDPNRNLPTKDWEDKAHKLWVKKQDRRKYPGKSAGSEAETRLQAYLIDKYRPDKILSFHAPLGFVDFDGPGDRKYDDLLPVEQRAKRVGLKIQKNTKRFLKFIDFRFYPGSLGNYAGNERKIPTYTVELPSAHASMGYAYWKIMRYALIKAMTYEIYSGDDVNSVLISQNTHINVPVIKYGPSDSIRSEAGKEVRE